MYSNPEQVWENGRGSQKRETGKTRAEPPRAEKWPEGPLTAVGQISAMGRRLQIVYEKKKGYAVTKRGYEGGANHQDDARGEIRADINGLSSDNSRTVCRRRRQ